MDEFSLGLAKLLHRLKTIEADLIIKDNEWQKWRRVMERTPGLLGVIDEKLEVVYDLESRLDAIFPRLDKLEKTVDIFKSLFAKQGDINESLAGNWPSEKHYYDLSDELDWWPPAEYVRKKIGWQSMDSAPKDRAILGCANGDMTVVKWWPIAGYWTLCESGSHSDDGEWTPEYWMELPEGPK